MVRHAKLGVWARGLLPFSILSLTACLDKNPIEPGTTSNLRKARPTTTDAGDKIANIALQLSGYTNDPEISVSWDAYPNVVATVVKISSVNNCDQSYTSYTVDGNQTILKHLIEGEYFLCIVGLDAKGNVIARNAEPHRLVIDRTPPRLTIVDSISLAKEDTLELTPEVFDVSPFEAKWSFAPDNAEVTIKEASATGKLVAAISQAGAYVAKLQVTDAAGNAATADVKVNVSDSSSADQPPKLPPASLAFEDTDLAIGRIGGTVTIGRAVSETDVESYKLYWGNALGKKVVAMPITTLAKTKANMTYTIATGILIPSSPAATHLLVFSSNTHGESSAAATLKIIDKGLPTALPASLNFTDESVSGGEVSGTLMIAAALDESNLTHYAIYWGSDASTKQDATPLATVPVSGGNVSFTFPAPTLIPTSPAATHFLVYGKNGDGETLNPKALAIVDVGVPADSPQSLTFTDEDDEIGVVGGTVVVGKAASESDVTHYTLYWGQSATQKLSLAAIATLSVTGSDVSYPLSAGTAIPADATHLLAFSSNADGENAVPAATAVVDLGVPLHKATDLNFADADLSESELQGTVTISRAADESDVDDYVVYWGSDATTKLDGTPIATIAKTETAIAITFAQDTPVPNGATHFLVFTKNDVGEMTDPFAAVIRDAAKKVFDYSGLIDTFTVPSWVTEVTIKAWGAGGGYSNHMDNKGGGGGFATATLAVTGGETLDILVGGAGQYTNRAGSGGGRSAVQRGGEDVLTAGGGGGAGCIYAGGGGGGLSGEDGPNALRGGKGGTQDAGGAGGSGDYGNGDPGDQYFGGQGSQAMGAGADGGFGGGGKGGECTGGGGGGYFGGGGGGRHVGDDGGGGGGSSFVPAGGTTMSATGSDPANTADADYSDSVGQGGQAAVNSGHGYPGRVIIIY